ncbi:MAG: VanZ family protein [Acidimicrobiia bacterium]
MTSFTSSRERKLWIALVLVLLGIFLTLGVANTLAEELRNRELFDMLFVVGFLLLLGAVATQGFTRRPGIAELGIVAGIAGVYLMVVARIGIPEERTHLFEYSLVALLIYLALAERRSNGGSAPLPWLTAIVVTAAIGLLDELIQWILPGRTFDYRDVGFNALAGLMAVAGVVGVAWAARRFATRE